jgi:hypothetical protein
LHEDFSVTVPGVGTFAFRAGWEFEASIPWWAIRWIRIMPLSACVLVASCVHDWLYCSKRFSRQVADHIFWQICLLDGVHEDKAHRMYLALRASGWWAWSRITQEQADEARTLGGFVPAAA